MKKLEFLPNLVDPSADLHSRLSAARALLLLHDVITTDEGQKIQKRIDLKIEEDKKRDRS